MIKASEFAPPLSVVREAVSPTPAGLNDEASSDAVLGALLAAARKHLGLEAAFISEFTGGQRIIRYIKAGSDIPMDAGYSDPLENTFCQRVVDGRLPELIRDAQDNPAALELEVTTALPVGAHLSTPVRLSDGSIYGTFCCFSRHGDPTLNERDLAVLHLFADVASHHLSRERARRHQRASVEQRVEDALTPGGMEMVYQPIVDCRDGLVIGVEALARFPSTPYRTPDVWFADANSVGRGEELEIHAVRLALASLPKLPAHMFLSVNVSPEVVVTSQRLRQLMATVDASRLVLEMTEHASIADYDDLLRVLLPWRQRGLSIAVDDAGAGYSSLRHILWLKPEWIKLDISITRNIDTDQPRAALGTALIDFASKVGSAIIAEGVETEAELGALQRLGVTAAQGYYLGRPADLDEGSRAIRAYPETRMSLERVS